MKLKEIETSNIRLSKSADFALYSLKDSDIKGVVREVKSAKAKLLNGSLWGNTKLKGTVYQLPYKNMVILIQIQTDHFEIIDILNKSIYNPDNLLKPVSL